MRIFVASLIVLAALYFWDKDYNNGKLLDGLERMGQQISRNMFHWRDLPHGDSVGSLAAPLCMGTEARLGIIAGSFTER
jgi:hypothetical protein